MSNEERILLWRLSIFAGGWAPEAAEAICSGDGVEASEILNLLTRLVDKSLVIAETQGGEAFHGAGLLAWAQGDFGRATVLLDKSIPLCQSKDDMSALRGCLERRRPPANPLAVLCRRPNSLTMTNTWP